MKKNIFTIIIMAATVINLVLTIVLVFSVMPAMNKTSNLVDKVASVIDLEIDTADDAEEEYAIEDLQIYEITYETSVKINLQKEPNDDSAHYAVLDGIVVSFNSKADDFEDVQKSVQTADVYIEDIVKETISAYSVSNINEANIKREAVKKIQEKYNTKAIVDISLPGFLTA